MTRTGESRPDHAHGRASVAPPDAATDAALAGLLRDMARDVAHELRSPVQSVVVNLEVLRRRAAKGEIEVVNSRADVLEQEVLRLHGLADAFVGLLREPPEEPVTMPVESLLAAAEPLIAMIARARHIDLQRRTLPAGVLVRAAAQPVVLAVIRLLVTLSDAGGRNAELVIEGDASPETFTLGLELRPQIGEDGAPATAAIRDRVAAVLPAANAWLSRTGGTASLAAGSESMHVRTSIQVPRAT